MWYVLLEILKETKIVYGTFVTERPTLARGVAILLGLILVVVVSMVGKTLLGGQSHVPTTVVRGQLNLPLSPADLRGAYICFWPERSGSSAINDVRPSMVRIWSEDGSFEGKVFVGRAGGQASSYGEYALTVLNGQLQPFSEKILPKAYGDPTQTPLRITSLRDEISIP